MYDEPYDAYDAEVLRWLREEEQQYQPSIDDLIDTLKDNG